MDSDTRKVSLVDMSAFNNAQHGGQMNKTLLCTPEHKRNVGRCLMQIKLRSTLSNIVEHDRQMSATCWFQQCWTMLHQHVTSGSLDISPA